MMPKTFEVVSRNGLYVAEFLPQTLGLETGEELRLDSWMRGGIVGRQFEHDAEREAAVLSVLASIEEVSEAELAYSTCTDGRWREALDDGQPEPLREQLTGTDTMVAFTIAEALGPLFYADPNAPFAARFGQVVDFLLQNKLKPSTHGHCGMAGGFVTVLGNIPLFAQNPAYNERQRLLLPVGEYNAQLAQETAATLAQRVADGRFEHYSAETVTKTIREKVGPHAIGNYRDDGRGVSGHVESFIARLQPEANGPRVAINPNKLASTPNGGQVFGNNDNRLIHLVNLFDRGVERDHLIALHAAEHATDAGHGTLARNMETVVIRSAA